MCDVNVLAVTFATSMFLDVTTFGHWPWHLQSESWTPGRGRSVTDRHFCNVNVYRLLAMTHVAKVTRRPHRSFLKVTLSVVHQHRLLTESLVALGFFPGLTTIQDPGTLALAGTGLSSSPYFPRSSTLCTPGCPVLYAIQEPGHLFTLGGPVLITIQDPGHLAHWLVQCSILTTIQDTLHTGLSSSRYYPLSRTPCTPDCPLLPTIQDLGPFANWGGLVHITIQDPGHPAHRLVQFSILTTIQGPLHTRFSRTTCCPGRSAPSSRRCV